MTSLHRTVRAKQQSAAEAHGRKAGYATGGAVEAKTAVHKHEKHLHRGELETKLKKGGRVPRKHGGSVPGAKPAARLDKRARGGTVSEILSNVGRNTKHPGQPQINADSEKATPNRAQGGAVHKRGSGKVNVIINTGGDDQQKIQAAKQEGMMQGAKMAAAAIPKLGAGAPGLPPGPPPGAPPMDGAPPMGPPPGAPPVPPPMRARGGSITKSPGKDALAMRQANEHKKDHMKSAHDNKGEIKVRAHTRKRGGAC